LRQRKPVRLLPIMLTLGLIASLILPAQQITTTDFEQDETQTSPVLSNITTFKPTVTKPFWVDRDDNGIADELDNEIASRLLNNTAGEHASVVIALRSRPTTEDGNSFILSGGYLTTSPWTYAIHGFGGQIPYNRIANFVHSDSNVLLVDKEHTSHAHISYAAQQIGARTYVWNTLGLQGDPESSIAIADTGIDDSHPDFTPGYGEQDFTRKIVGWNDQITPGTAAPYDDNGHGSHVSGLATGNGFFSTDASGNAVATWGANLGDLATKTYNISGMMVNKTGIITIKLKWSNFWKGQLTALRLWYGDKTLNTASWTEAASVNTPNQETWYTLTYNVASVPSGGYDMYHIRLSFKSPSIFDDFYVVFTVSWPYTAPADGFEAWTGIAPQTKLVGSKVLDYSGSGTDTGLLNAIDWIIANRQRYHIVITSMSLGFGTEVPAVDNAITNLVNSGITTVISAGNDGAGANNIFTPGSVDEVITVAASNQFDNIVSFSSQGGTSMSTGNTIKPDIAAPGGSFYAVPLLSADSNDYDADAGWLDTTSNDAALMQGTSMSAPIVSGATSIIIQVMGGYANWNYTREQALLPKMILLMTATETYPNQREPASSAAPTLERGGKDAHEGYGRLNLDAAADAILKTYQIGTTVAEALGRSPTLSNIAVLGQKLAWARRVQLKSYASYNFTLTVPTGADFDLYLYNSTGTHYGEPAIVAKSTNATTGGREQIILTPTYSGTYYLVVKRATASTGSGTFTLESVGKIVGDVNSDGSVDITDLSIQAQAFGSAPGAGNWNPECDIQKDDIIDVSDLARLGKNYNRTV